MNLNTIRSLIDKSAKQPKTTFIDFIVTNFKTIKKYTLYLLITIAIIKPSIPAHFIGKIVDAFVYEYIKIKKKYA